MEHSRVFGLVCLVLAALLWSCTPVFVKHFAKQVIPETGRPIDPDVQNLFRYASGAMALWLMVAAKFRGEALRGCRRWRVLLMPVAINCIFQVVFVQALYIRTIYPAFTSLLSQTSVVFAVALAFALFPDERRRIRSWRYAAGALLAFLGVAGVIVFDPRAAASAEAGARADLSRGAALILVQSFLWGSYTVAMKRLVREVRPIVAFAFVATLTSIFFLVLACVRSDPRQFFWIGLRDQILMVISGIGFIAVTHSLYFRAVERLGVGVCAPFLLVTPLATGLISWAWHGERLAHMQIFMGAVLLAGALLVVLAARVENDAPGPGR